ncbi:hypothetical protein TNCV_2415531 [Trichonephila clavipes]|nr:hypothetical protein TNCV_2415531 [Trichonephila clavipes]
MISSRPCSPISQRKIHLVNADPDEIPVLRTPDLLEIIIQEPQLPAVYESTRLRLRASKTPYCNIPQDSTVQHFSKIFAQRSVPATTLFPPMKTGCE